MPYIILSNINNPLISQIHKKKDKYPYLRLAQ